MRFLTVFVNILCTAVVTVLGSDEKRDVTDEDWALIDPIDYGGTNDQIDYTGTIEASKLDCDQAGLTYGCCDGPDYFDSWIVAGCDICKSFFFSLRELETGQATR